MATIPGMACRNFSSIASIMVKFVFALLFGSLAMFAQWHVIVLAMSAPDMQDGILAILAWQALAASLSAGGMVFAMPVDFPGHRMQQFLHIFSLCLFMPVVGVLLFVSAYFLVPALFRHFSHSVRMSQVEPAEYISHLASSVNHGSGSHLRSRLTNTNVSDEDRLSALVSMQFMPPYIIGDLQHDLLSDPVEEVRLLAYGVVDSAEKSITRKIVAAREQLDLADEDGLRADIYTRLAELYWELIYQNLVRGEVGSFTLECVERYARLALRHNQEMAAMWYLLGRCALLRINIEESEACFARALENNFPESRLLPWQAEVAYLKRDYAKLRKLLKTMDEGINMTSIQHVSRYWLT
ncbi:hypothetical protein CEK28_17705 [Xenophilus sp. AP218F]|nr:hypothetical protein CEK28_17705 [Xenophilus sp. AP218F]